MKTLMKIKRIIGFCQLWFIMNRAKALPNNVQHWIEIDPIDIKYPLVTMLLSKSSQNGNVQC